MVFRWAAALCESMKPKSAHLADPVAVAVAVVVVADTAAAVQTAVVVAAAAHAAGNCLEACRKASSLT
jgi:hypothetical protein